MFYVEVVIQRTAIDNHGRLHDATYCYVLPT